MYHFKENVNWKGYFSFDKKWIQNMHIAAIPDSSKSVLPVILSFCDDKGVAFPSYDTISALTGLSIRTVQEAVKGLVGFPGFEIIKRQTRFGRTANKYIMSEFPPRNEAGRALFFFKGIIEGGNWRMLRRPVSAGLYLAMRYFGQFYFEDYIEHEAIEAGYDEVVEVYKARKWDLCSVEISQLAKYAGITRPSVYEGLKDLESNHLIEKWPDRDGIRAWKVYRTYQQKYFRRDFLNEQIGLAKRIEREKAAGRRQRICKKSSGGHVKNLQQGVKKEGVMC